MPIMNTTNPALDTYATLLRKFKVAFLVAYLLQCLIAVFFVFGPTDRWGWNADVLTFFLCSVVPATLIYLAAEPLSRRFTRSDKARLFTFSLVRFLVAGNLALIGLMSSFILDAGATPLVLVGGTALLLLVIEMLSSRTAR
jgi:hypothetical protein